jgi:DnaJ-class molecular chaperone
MPDYYEILGVSKDANETDIKKAYRTLSLEFHPDRNPDPNATTKFQEISEAYETLSDPAKKQEYDQPNHMHGHPGFGNDFDDINNMFNMMFANSMGMGMGMGGMPNIRIFHNGFPVITKPNPIQQEVRITLEEAYYGIPSMKIFFERSHNGHLEKDHINIPIPKGIDNGEVMVLKDMGHVVQDRMKGDLHLIIMIQPHANFERKGLDLFYKKSLSLKEALCGFTLEIPHLNGKVLRISHSATSQVIKPNDKRPIQDYGMLKDGHTNGHLIIVFDILFPEKLTESQIQLLKDIL